MKEEKSIIATTLLDSGQMNSLNIREMIYNMRKTPVMLDSDLAFLYGYEVKRLNEQVRRNITRFPKDFMFQLTREEVEFVKSQNATSRNETLFSGQNGGRRKLPYAFTEQGIYMLATVLKGELAEKQSIYIMRAFREMRQFIANNALMFEKISNIELRQLEYQKQADEKFDQIFEYISNHEESNQKIFFEGQIFDAFYIMTELIRQANEEIILIDGYVDVVTLNILAKKKSNVKVTIYTLPNAKLSTQDIENFNNQYRILDVKRTKAFHDRFLIIDNKTGYHIGASIKDAGKKCFGINKIEDVTITKELLEKAEKSSL